VAPTSEWSVRAAQQRQSSRRSIVATGWRDLLAHLHHCGDCLLLVLLGIELRDRRGAMAEDDAGRLDSSRGWGGAGLQNLGHVR